MNKYIPKKQLRVWKDMFSAWNLNCYGKMLYYCSVRQGIFMFDCYACRFNNFHRFDKGIRSKQEYECIKHVYFSLGIKVVK